jgi:hypothetical protein
VVVNSRAMFGQRGQKERGEGISFPGKEGEGKRLGYGEVLMLSGVLQDSASGWVRKGSFIGEFVKLEEREMKFHEESVFMLALFP